MNVDDIVDDLNRRIDHLIETVRQAAEELQRQNEERAAFEARLARLEQLLANVTDAYSNNPV